MQFFLASLVEVVEAFIIVLVVETLRGSKSAVLSTGAMSMAAGEYVSVSSQADAEEASLAR